MALPSNYKQIAVGTPSGPSTPTPSRSRSSGAGGGSDRNKDTTPVFTHSNYGNPAFTPQKVGKSSGSKNQADSRGPKQPKAPEKPVLPYMRYSKRIWDSVKAQFPDLKLWELGKKIGAMWKQLNESEKQEFIDEYEADKAEYEKALKAYHSSPAYQAFMAAKNKVKSDADVHETPSRAGGKSQQERRIDIQPAEDEDDQDEGYSFKHLAYARYLRNHRLINEIFSDAVVPDVRSVVTTQRMQVLKRQVSSLTMHQTKLEAELQQMEEKFEAKKQRMMESSEAFQEELKRHCKPAVDDDTFQKMVQRIYEEMKRDRQRFEDPNVNAAAVAAAASAANAAAVHRAEENKPISAQPPVLPTPNIAQPSAAKKDILPTQSPFIMSKPHEATSKTEPEPMDIEPTPKPSVPLPQKPEMRAAELPKPMKPVMDMGKDVAMKGGPVGVKPQPPPSQLPMISQQQQQQQQGPQQQQVGKVPTPTPTPPPQAPPPSALATEHPQSMSSPTPPPLPTVSAIPNNPPITGQGVPPPPPPQQQQVPSSMPMHPHHGQPHPHLPQHMPPHQPMSGMPPHTGYSSYGAHAGPTRSPYYQPQYGAHPSQPYGQYAPYSHYQQPYGPPPGSHYMRPPQHNGSPVHYTEHGAPVAPGQPQQAPPPGHLPPHDVYGQPPHSAMPPQQQPMPAAVPTPPPPTSAAAGPPIGGAPPTTETGKNDNMNEKKEGE